MNLIYIDEFVTLVEVGNYQRAADKLFITQSALSKHIKTLEKDLGYELFVRKYHKLELTEEGKIFLAHANNLTNEYRKLLTDSAGHTMNKKSKIVVACSYTKRIRMLPHLVIRFHKEFPDCALSILQIETCEAESILENGVANIALVLTDDKPVTLKGFHSEMLSECARMKMFLPASHRLASNHALRLEQLTKENFVTLPKVAYSTILREKVLKEKNLQFNIAHAVSRRETANSFVKNGLAVFLGLEDLNSEDEYIPGIVTLPLEPDIKLYLQLIYPQENLSVEEKWVIDRLKLL